jgi:serine/threonine protein kinase/Flp pilus assembly protein TadD
VTHNAEIAMSIDPQRLKHVFLGAVEIADRAERQAWIVQECGPDRELLARVQALLKARDDPDSLIDRLAPAPEAVAGTTGPRRPDTSPGSPHTAPAPGQHIGPYKLLQRLGEGGFGIVYLAEQEQPVKRKVAVKVLKPGLDSAAVLARFEAERQALALMDHPNIARVFDGGLTDDLRPYFVMELIKGIPITKYCDQERLSPRERLDLFIPVCQAVQHAHQKGIIHRDVKPSNVLIGLYDGRPVPKVIDFGVAKATGQKLTERTMFTEVGQIIGTLEYMAPEQAELNNLDIDTRADIYSLGVLLYELLTGSPPFTARQLRSAAFSEMLRIIREVEPQKPSTRVSMADDLPNLAAARKLEPKKLAALMRGDLDWIVMKCLEKERSRRYETANGLALEIQRYLADEPVLAGPPAVSYRLRKFVRRNRGAVLATALLLLALVAGITGTTVGLIWAMRARADEGEQRRIAQDKEQEAQAEKKRAIEFRDKALDALRAMTDEDVKKLIGEKKELGANERAYLEAIIKRWQAFAYQVGTDEQARSLRAEGHGRVGQLWYNLGRRDEARVEWEQARDTYRSLAEQFPALPNYQDLLANTHCCLGTILARLGKRDEARDQYTQALDIQENLGARFPAVPDYQRKLAMTHGDLGTVLAGLGKWDEARGEYQQAADIQQKLTAQFPTVPKYQQELALTYNGLGNMLAELGKRDEALGALEHSQEIQQKLAARFPAVPDYQQELAMTHNNLGNLLAKLGKRDEARGALEQSRDIRQKLAAQFPAMPDYQDGLANTHMNLGALLAKLGRRAEAQGEFEQARDIQQKLATQFPQVPEYRVKLGGAYGNLARLLREGGKPADSLPWFDKAIATLTAVYEKEPRDVTAKQFLSNDYCGRAIAFDDLHRHAEAVKDWDKAIELSPKLEQAGWRKSRATSRLQAGQVAEAVAEVAELTKLDGWNTGQWYDFACVYAVASGKVADKKQEYADRAMELLRKAVQAGYKDGAHMAKDTDLDPLRDREDFKKLLAEVQGGKGKD